MENIIGGAINLLNPNNRNNSDSAQANNPNIDSTNEHQFNFQFDFSNIGNPNINIGQRSSTISDNRNESSNTTSNISSNENQNIADISNNLSNQLTQQLNEQFDERLSNLVSRSLLENVLRELQTGISTSFSGNSLLQKISSHDYKSSSASVMPLGNVPGGIYRVTVGANSFKADTNAEAYIWVEINHKIYREQRPWFIGITGTNFLTNENNIVIDGVSGSKIIHFPKNVNHFQLHIFIKGKGLVLNPYYILEKQNTYKKISTEWN